MIIQCARFEIENRLEARIDIEQNCDPKNQNQFESRHTEGLTNRDQTRIYCTEQVVDEFNHGCFCYMFGAKPD